MSVVGAESESPPNLNNPMNSLIEFINLQSVSQQIRSLNLNSGEVGYFGLSRAQAFHASVIL